MIWLAPVVLALVAAVPIAVGVRRVAREASALRRQVAALAELRTSAVELRDEAKTLRASVPELGFRTRPSDAPAS